jgi:hypothetical protein
MKTQKTPNENLVGKREKASKQALEVGKRTFRDVKGE